MGVFVTKRHNSLWNALAQFEIEPQYFNFLRRLCADQQATVLRDKESDVLEGDETRISSLPVEQSVVLTRCLRRHCRTS